MLVERTKQLEDRSSIAEQASELTAANGYEIQHTRSVKILGLIIDSRMRKKKYTAHAATRSLRAAIPLKWLRGSSPSVTRKLVNATVVPVVDCTSFV